jgi:hypothetical protein
MPPLEFIELDPTRRRPAGTFVLAGLFTLMALLLLLVHSLHLVRSYSMADKVNIHPSFAVMRAIDLVSVVSGLAAAVGLVARRRWGWFISVFYCCWRVAEFAVLPISVMLIAGALYGAELNLTAICSKLVGAGMIFGPCLAYLFRAQIMWFFKVDPAERLQAALILVGMSFPFVTGLYLLSMALSRDITLLPAEIAP